MTSHIKLLPIEPRLAETPTLQAAELVRDAVRQNLEFLAKNPRPAPWIAYLAVDDKSQIVGTCAFVYAPDSEGTVEIAYFTFPPHEGKGHATAMAEALIALAKAQPGCRRVIAHTLPQKNASTRILEKAGMILVGEAEDADAGKCWRWALGLR